VRTLNSRESSGVIPYAIDVALRAVMSSTRMAPCIYLLRSCYCVCVKNKKRETTRRCWSRRNWERWGRRNDPPTTTQLSESGLKLLLLLWQHSVVATLPAYLKSNQLWRGKAFSSSVMQNMSQGRVKETEIEAIPARVWRFGFSVTTKQRQQQHEQLS